MDATPTFPTLPKGHKSPHSPLTKACDRTNHYDLVTLRTSDFNDCHVHCFPEKTTLHFESPFEEQFCLGEAEN